MRKNSSLFIRVGTTYYKTVKMPLISGDVVEILVMWNRQTIIDDHGKDYLENIPKYDGFCNIPSHTNYKESLENFLNMYEKLNEIPESGSIENFKRFMKHIFQNQYEIALDYLTILYQNPTQLLPVLCLVSKERGTGKTTFLNMMKALFQKNMTYNTNEDFRSQFTSEWVNKLIIAIDEVLLDRNEDSERIKNLSTARTIKSEAKGKDRFEIEFFGKFILCSNNEDDFIQIGPGETRYWVVKVNQIEDEDTFLLQKLKKEVPAIMYFLENRKVTNLNKSRMWFHPSLLRTNALMKVIRKNSSKIENEILLIIEGFLDSFDLEEFKFTLGDLFSMLSTTKYRNITRAEIAEILQTKWGLQPLENSTTYKQGHLQSNGNYQLKGTKKGRCYTISKKFLIEKRLTC